MKCGNLVHSRWVATAEAFIFLWFSEHGLQEELLDRLEMIVTFVVQVGNFLLKAPPDYVQNLQESEGGGVGGAVGP